MQGSATTSLDVLNLALSTLGKDHCDSFDPSLGIEPESVEGKKVARLFNKAIDDVQRDFYWHELITTEVIAADIIKSHDGRYRYPLPDDCIRPLGVRLPSDGETLIPTAYTRLIAQDSEYCYDIEGNFLLTGAGKDVAGDFTAEIVYIRRAISPADWTSELLDCIVAKLAADAALSVTGEYRLAQALKEDYRRTIRSDARRLQSKYKTNETRMPRGFGAWRANRG